jgi:raffinose/stachyose/melibiose transport system permease protein
MKLRGSSSRLSYFVLTVPALVLYSLFLLYPVLSGFYYSLTDWNGISRKFRLVGFRNFSRLFHDERVYNSLGVTFLYTAILTVAVTVLALVLALILNRRMKLRLVFRTVYFFPTVLSLILAAIVFNNFFSIPLPALGASLHIPFFAKSLVSGARSALYAILIVNVWQGVAIPFVIFLTGLQTVPTELLESAKIDGATPLQSLRRIVLPFLVPSFQVVIILLLRQGLTTFDYVKVMTDGGPGFATETLPILIYVQAFGGRMNFSYAITESVLLFFLMAVLSFFQFRFFASRGVDQL